MDCASYPKPIAAIPKCSTIEMRCRIGLICQPYFYVRHRRQGRCGLLYVSRSRRGRCSVRLGCFFADRLQEQFGDVKLLYFFAVLAGDAIGQHSHAERTG